MFSEWRKRSKLFEVVCGDSTVEHMTSRERNAYDLARAAFKAGVRAGIKQEQELKEKAEEELRSLMTRRPCRQESPWSKVNWPFRPFK